MAEIILCIPTAKNVAPGKVLEWDPWKTIGVGGQAAPDETKVSPLLVRRGLFSMRGVRGGGGTRRRGGRKVGEMGQAREEHAVG